MIKWITQLQYCWLFCLGFAFLVSTAASAVAPADSISHNKSEQANYILGRRVIGSSGVLGARSSNNFHSATAGQTIIGRAQNANNIVVAGFWILSAGPTEVSPAEKPNLPTEFALHQNYPNPFNPETVIEYDLPNACLVTVEIFNTVGQRIRLISSQVQGPGYAQVVWDGRDDQGKVMGSGVYFYQVTAFSAANKASNHQIQFQQTKKMLFVK